MKSFNKSYRIDWQAIHSTNKNLRISRQEIIIRVSYYILDILSYIMKDKQQSENINETEFIRKASINSTATFIF